MYSDHEAIRQHLLNSLGVSVSSKPVNTHPDLTVLRETEWSEKFEQFMRNRLIMGSFRYGTLEEKKKIRYDYIGYIFTKLKSYKETGNLEALVDVANLCLLEFINPSHENPVFKPEDNLISCKIL